MTSGRQVAQDGFVFFLDELIGHGASADVVAVREQSVVAGMTGMGLAAKVLHLSREAEAPGEIARMQRLADYPSVVGYRKVMRLDARFDEYADRVALVLERGVDSLGGWRRNRVGAAGDDEVGQVLMGAARGLKSLHSNHVAHADLHAGNVLLTRAGWKIADLSASRPVDRRTGISAPPPGVGSPQVYSPQRHRTGLASTFDDMWALGVLLVYTATGRYPFRSGLTPDLVDQTLDGLTTQLRPIAAGLLAWDPNYRLTAAQLLSRLADAGLGQSAVYDPAESATQTRRMMIPAGVSSYRPGHAEAFMVHERSVEHAWSMDEGHSWSPWHPMPFDAPIRDVTAGSHAVGQQEVFALGEDGIIRHRWLFVDPATDQHDGWSDSHWLTCAPLPPVAQIAAASIADGHLEVFAVDEIGHLWSRWYWSDHGWSDWTSWDAPVEQLDGVLASSVRNLSDPATRAVVVVEDCSGAQWARAYRISRPGWGDWTPVRDAVPTIRGIATYEIDGHAMLWPDSTGIQLDETRLDPTGAWSGSPLGSWLGSTSDNVGVILYGGRPVAKALTG